MTDKPLLFADIDGCFNPVPFRAVVSKDWKWERTFRSNADSGGFNLNLSSEMGAAIESLGCDITWLTTWIVGQDHANPNVGKALGWELKPYPIIPEDPYIFWKVMYMKDVLAQPGPKVIWIDDEATEFSELFSDQWDLDPHNRLLIINPETDIGITKDHIDTMKVFLNDNQT
jgi:hypothetical protein